MASSRFAAAVASALLLILPARGANVLRIAMTASDIPTTTGMPNNGFEGMRFNKIFDFAGAGSRL